jgi:hypothetical protein
VTYDGRGNLITISGHYSTGSALHEYVLTNVFDEHNRRIEKHFYDVDDDVEGRWLFHYDIFDRLVFATHRAD